ncbi:metal-sensitive transcriptional regulator [Vulcanimicrobium alpinum]|uniref:metal-sensitive transcriptional regulator n=1 Tax=Vulcanimicrobium alpinum TaxID=3016050 RepID=UPI00295F41F3|nr:metal-sensitive transcriptional regulator [Vulcanimicrobium alpinum]
MPAASKSDSRRLTLPDDEVRALQRRLRRVEGQIRAIQRMLDERADCHAVVQQMSAARGALDRSMVQLMVGSMAECMRDPRGAVDEREMRRLGERFAKLL